MTLQNQPLKPTQRSRASMEILGNVLKYSSGTIREIARDNFRATEEGQALAKEFQSPHSEDEMMALVDRATATAESDNFYRLERFYQRLVAEEIMSLGIITAEERRPIIEERLKTTPNSAGSTLELDPDLPIPDYFDGVEYHLMPGGWDGYDLYGRMMTGGSAFRYGGYAAVPFGSNIYQQRKDVIRQLPKASYAKIYEPGCGANGTLQAIHEIFPEAELTACDLSPGLLRRQFDSAQRLGLKVTLKQRDARFTGEPDDTYDAVVSYAVHHEAPVKENIEILAEMFRILKPGGDMVISDPPPFRAVEPFHAAVLHWDTAHREEPYFSVTCLANWDEEMKKIGFVNVESYALGPDSYPWVTRASKPAA
jgi:SAM-dependent methyltransferase